MCTKSSYIYKKACPQTLVMTGQNVMRECVCLVIYSTTVHYVASFLNCTPLGLASDTIKTSTFFVRPKSFDFYLAKLMCRVYSGFSVLLFDTRTGANIEHQAMPGMYLDRIKFEGQHRVTV